MKMLEAQAGLGMGIKKFRTIFVFETKGRDEPLYRQRLEVRRSSDSGSEVGQKRGSYQGAVQVMPGVWMYQLTDKGLALELTGNGTKYYKDDDLN